MFRVNLAPHTLQLEDYHRLLSSAQPLEELFCRRLAPEIKSLIKDVEFRPRLLLSHPLRGILWVSNLSPKAKIVESGLWLVNGLYKTPFTMLEIDHLEARLKRNYFSKNFVQENGQ